MEITPGIRRLGTGIVNAYLVEDAGEITIVDAGAPGYWSDLHDELDAMGRTIADVRAVVLTHAHIDHVGFAGRLHRERGVPIRLHEADVELAREPHGPKRNQPTIRPVPLMRFVWFAMTHGMLRQAPILEVAAFGDGATLDVPGAPRVIHVPGHSEGSAAIHFVSRDAIFVGDAFVTYDILSGETGPRVGPYNADPVRAFDSLARLDRVDARLVLPGHGLPWNDGLSEALRRVREIGRPR